MRRRSRRRTARRSERAGQGATDIVGDPRGVSVGVQAARQGVHLGDGLGDAGPDHRVPVLVKAERPVDDRPAEQPGERGGHVVVGDQLRAAQPVGLPGMRAGEAAIAAAAAPTSRASTIPIRPCPADEPKLLVAAMAGAKASTFCM